MIKLYKVFIFAKKLLNFRSQLTFTSLPSALHCRFPYCGSGSSRIRGPIYLQKGADPDPYPTLYKYKLLNRKNKIANLHSNYNSDKQVDRVQWSSTICKMKKNGKNCTVGSGSRSNLMQSSTFRLFDH